MKTLIFICILAVVAADLNAQIEKISKVLEPAVLECRYQCIQKLDTLGVTSPDFVIVSPKILHQRVWRFSDALPSTWFGCKPPCS